jgi:hypothetical protein
MLKINFIQIATIFRPANLSTSRFQALIATLILAWLTIAVPVQAAALKEDDLLLLDVKLGQQTLASSVTSYAVGDTAMMSLAEFGSALDFPIDVDPIVGTANGSFIKPTRSFKLDIKAGFVEIEGKRLPVSRDDVLVHQGAIFATIGALSQWFPVDLRLQAITLSVEVKPRERLPVQERDERRRGAQQTYSIGPATLPLIDTPYKLLGPPAADIGLSYSITRPSGGKPHSSETYSALVSGDVAYMDSKLYLNGDQSNSLTDARFTLSRDKLGLPLGLRYTEIGDIVPAIVPGLNYGGVERGFLIQGGGSAIGRDDLINSDTINLSGDALPGWDVELFQNGMRVGYQAIGPEGRYNFANLDPFAGENTLELVFYGPSGERRSETVVRNSGLGPDQPGSVRYQLSASQQGRPLYQGSRTPDPNLTDIGSARVAAGMEVRVLTRLSLRGSWNNIIVNGQRLNYSSLGASTGWRDISLSADATRDPLRGTTWNGTLQLPAQANIWGFDTRFNHTQYAQTVLLDTTQSPQSSQGGQTTTLNPTTSQVVQITSRTGLTLSRTVGQTGLIFLLNRNRGVIRNFNSATLGFTSRLDRLTVGNTLNYYRFDPDSTGVRLPNRMAGNAFFSTGGSPMSLRGGINYTLKPYKKAEQYFLDSDLTVAKDMSVNFGLTYTPLNRIASYTSGLNWQLPGVTLSPRVTYNSDKTYSGFIYASFSLAPRPDRGGVMFNGQSLATAGTIAARVFVDNDNSNSFTSGDQPLPVITVRAPQGFRTAITDEHGVAYLTGLTSPRATDVVLAEDTMPTQMNSKNRGNSVRPRPNAPVVIDFPVTPTGEIDGHVYSMAFEKRAPLGGALVELRNSEDKVIAFKASAADGYYVFENTPYGSYALNLAGDRRERANQPKVTLNRDHGSQLNTDIILAQLTVETLAAPSGELRPITPAAAPKIEALASLPAKTPAMRPAPVPVSKPATEQALPLVPKISDGRLVQVGAFSNVGAAKVHRLKMLELGLMRSEQVKIVRVDLGPRGIFHRVVATPINETADELCRSLKKRGADCFAIDPWF